MYLDLSGKTALVTGAGRGIGRAIAERLAASGASVVLNDLDEEPAVQTKEIIEKSHHRNVRAIAGDVTIPEFPQQLIQAALTQFGSLDILINNAGYTWDGAVHKTTDDQFQAMLDIHVVAPFRMLRALAPWLRETAKKETKEGRPVMRKVVNITSVSAVDGISNQSGYGSGKGAVIGLTKVIAKEWGGLNVNVNAVAYGFMQTRLTEAQGAQGNEITVHGQTVKLGIQSALIGFMKEQTPLGRLGTMEDAVGPLMFFCSRLSDFVTGEVLVCSGGSRMPIR